MRRFLFYWLILYPVLMACNLGQPIGSGSPQDLHTPDDYKVVQALKILVSGAGVFEIGAQELIAAGWDIGKVDPAQLQLFYRGLPQSFFIEGEGDALRLRFYAQESLSLYTRQNVYWLVMGDMPENLLIGELPEVMDYSSSAVPLVPEINSSLPSSAYLASVRLEQNQVYSPLVEEGEHWFWLTLPAPQRKDFEFVLSAVSPGSGRLMVELWSSTEAPQEPDHHVKLFVNGQLVADETWDGRGRRTILADLPSGLVRDGKNDITLEAPGDTGVVADINFLDWIALQYPRQFLAEDDQIEFMSQGGMHRLTGFSGEVTVFDITEPMAAFALKEIEQNSGELIIEGIADHRYLVVGPDGILPPDEIQPAILAPDLREATLGADYIAIGPPDLLAALKPLLDWRENQGMQVKALPLEVIYDQFDFGLPEPEAIRSFLRYAVQNWEPAPWSVLLVGDSTYDPRGYISSPEANRLPTFLVNTVYGGETGSDVVFGQLDGDYFPDLAIGRVPARTPEQVQAFVQKTLAYEQETADQNWRGRVLAIADGESPMFRDEAYAFLGRFPETYRTELLGPSPGTSDAGRQIVNRLREGDLLVAYFGHGSLNMWGKDRLFTNQDALELDNGSRLPVVINMTCLTGLFTHPTGESLTEILLWQKNGGAVAVLAATSLTLPTDQSFLSNGLVNAFLSDPRAPLGKILLQARKQVPTDTQRALDVMQTFLLFGDPALRLAVSEDLR